MALTATPDQVEDAFRKTDMRLRQLVRALKREKPDNDEVELALKRARKRTRENKELLGEPETG